MININKMSNKINISLQHLDLVTKWELAGSIHECTLCRRSLLAPSLNELNTEKNAQLTVINGEVSIGECKHLFHKDCISNFVNGGCILCPIDKLPWKTSKVLKTGTSYGTAQKVAIKTKSS